MRTFWDFHKTLTAVDGPQPECWIQMTCPTADDESYLVDQLGVPKDFMRYIQDRDERSRYDVDSDWQLIILRIPFRNGSDTTPHSTVPLGILLYDKTCITVCYHTTEMMTDFVSYQSRRNIGFTDCVDLVFRLMLSSSVWYLKYLRQIGGRLDTAKHNLDDKISNSDLVGLARLQDTLTYFITSIRENENLLAKLRFKLPIDDLDADLIEDINIEMNQARELTTIYSDLLDSTMQTYASVINNNMSDTMKKMTSASIILMFPTLVASVFGMNLISGMESSWWGFPLIIVFSLAITLLIFLLFRRNSWI